MRAAYWAAYQAELERLDARRCSKGYECGNSCIPLAKECRKTPAASYGKERLRRISALSKGEPEPQKSNRPSPRSSATKPKEKVPNPASPELVTALKESKEFDGFFKAARRLDGEDPNYDFNRSVSDKASLLGQGAFGVVMKDPGPPPVAVKRGEVNELEADLINRLGKADLGPRLIRAELGAASDFRGLNDLDGIGVNTGYGKIAMSLVPGAPSAGVSHATRLPGSGTFGDKFWAARATMHRMGIAHNDMHPGNVFLDKKDGKVRFVDMGLAQDNVKAALSEALGGISARINGTSLPPGDFVTSDYRTEFMGSGDSRPKTLQRMQKNSEKVIRKLQSWGFSGSEIAALHSDSIRRPIGDYKKGPWGKLTDKQTKELIETLYEGV